MGLSSDPEKAQRQLAALEAGRRKGAEALLGDSQGSSKASQGKKPAKAKPGRSQGSRRQHSYDAPAEPGQAKADPPPADPPAEDPPRKGLLERAIGAFDG